MEVSVKYIDNHKFIAQAGNHQLIIDQAKDKGGNDEGMNPLEVFLVSVAACAGFYAKTYCKNANIDAGNLSVSVNSELSQDVPKRFKDIKVQIDVGQDLAQRKEALLNFVKNCPVHNTIKIIPMVDFII
ncbi:MAG: OsmC family protein [Candidatus Omnitrophota bacterium]|nr:OsmC family protein [Candidatus Omnitrophota bacterium]